MTLDEAIKHAEEVAEENEKFCYKKGGEGGYFNEDTDWDNVKCAAEHRQLAEWLKDYQRILEQQPCEDCVSRAEALEAIRQIHPVDTEYDCTLYDKVDIMYVLNDLPSVTPSYNSIKTELKPSEDCVSRAEAEAIFKNARKALYELSRKEQIKDFQTREMMLLNAEQFIHLLPSVAPKPKMGRWDFTKHYGRDYYMCSVCGMERMDDHSSGWNYCPACGAKMQEVEE